MKKAEIQVGGRYRAKVSGKFTTVRVDAIREVTKYRRGWASLDNLTTGLVYDVTNLTTGRQLTFASAARFIKVVASLPQ
jgi:hypothetical protein